VLNLAGVVFAQKLHELPQHRRCLLIWRTGMTAKKMTRRYDFRS
jgi:hypothetical protein